MSSEKNGEEVGQELLDKEQSFELAFMSTRRGNK